MGAGGKWGWESGKAADAAQTLWHVYSVLYGSMCVGASRNDNSRPNMR